MCKNTSDTMKMTHSAAAIILEGLRKKGMTRKELSERMGLSPSWATKLLKGADQKGKPGPKSYKGVIQYLKDEQVRQIEGILDVRFFGTVASTADQSSLASQLAEHVDTDKDMALIASGLVSILGRGQLPGYIEPKNMVPAGEACLEIFERYKEKPGKMLKILLQELTEWATNENKN